MLRIQSVPSGSNRNLRLFFKKKLIIFILLPNTLNILIRKEWTGKTRPSGSCFCIQSKAMAGQTRRTRHDGRVLRVWVKGVLGEYPRCEERDHMVVFFASGQYRVQGTRDTPDTKNATLGSRFHVWGVGYVPYAKNTTIWSRSSCLGGRR